MKEIGSEFWNIPIKPSEAKLFPDHVRWYLSGRTALRAVLRDIHGAQTAALPRWCCDSMIQPFIDAGLSVRFYDVNACTGSNPVCVPDLSCDVLLIMDYFGYTSPAPDLASFGGVVIRDVTHSILSGKYDDADYYFGSLRKWCGVWTGGYAWKRDGVLPHAGKDADAQYIALRREAMELKLRYMENGGTEADKSAFLERFGAAEELLDEGLTEIQAASRRDIDLAAKLDAGFIRKSRRENAEVLRSALKDLLVFPDMRETDCPMFVPIYVPRGMRNSLRSHLIEQKVYCPVHWPLSPLHDDKARGMRLYTDCLSLVCDQRYTADDMLTVAKVIHRTVP
ncbi:MAG: hypothetical protein Q4G47_02430 [Lachnospiraceae bacterium]|nr:hypothetical protein [Lachnospiraceae bacterium]